MEEKEKKTFEITGEFLEKKQAKKFSKQVGAQNENTAREKLLAEFGSKHGLKRRHVKISTVKEVSENGK